MAPNDSYRMFMAINESNRKPVVVEVWESAAAMRADAREEEHRKFKSVGLIRRYEMDHNDEGERIVLGRQVKYAFDAGQCVVTYPRPR